MSNDHDDTSLISIGLGYLVGLGSILLYTPIAYRIYRLASADGLTLSTWWLKLGSYACSDVFYITKGYPISTYIETLTITVEAAIVLLLVAYYQRRLWNLQFASFTLMFVVLTAFGLLAATSEVVAAGQLGSVALNSGALLPQFLLNYQTQSKGDYSPVTATLASVGCAIRIFTTITLNNADPILLTTFSVAFTLNFALLLQILYYGVFVEGLSPLSVLISDVASSSNDETKTTSVNGNTIQ